MKFPHIKSSWIFGTLSCLLIGYLVAAAFVTTGLAEQRMCTGVTITVHDTAELKFVTARELANELADFPSTARSRRLSTINMDSLEQMLQTIDKIETVSVNALTDGKIHIDINPMRPVARIFDDMGQSYYINRTGKRIIADARYHLDVPVVQGTFHDESFPAVNILPLIDYIASDSAWTHAISMIKVDSPRDVILIPVIRGHVINIGEPRDFPDKFARIQAMYRKVLPVKGWEYYDTLSVKWRGQVVATRRNKVLAAPVFDDHGEEEEVELSSMLAADGVAPGRTLPGQKAHDDMQIPAAKVHKHTANDSVIKHNQNKKP